MQPIWQPAETSTHQDAVVAHVIGASILGYFIHDETVHLLLDIGFIWSIYLDGQMVLLPHPVATSELPVDEATRRDIRDEIDELLSGRSTKALRRFKVPPLILEIGEAAFYECGEQRQIRLRGDGGDLVLTTDLEQNRVEVNFAE